MQFVLHYCDGKPTEEDNCVTLSLIGRLLDNVYENFHVSAHPLEFLNKLKSPMGS